MNQDVTTKQRRIAKNTLLLYVRMLFMMLISLYTSRVNLNALGVTDFGIFNVVGGFVGMFSVISGSLSAAISRFITFELGKGGSKKLSKVFSSSVTIQIALALIIVILTETIGLWFLYNKMVIPADRMYAANFVFQFSVLSFCIGLVSVPYYAAIIAHEKMSAFAYITILEAILKLGIAITIVYSPIDRLIYFSGLILINSCIIRSVYGYYCKKHFEECTYHFCFDKELLKRMFSFAGWNFIGASSAVLRDEGGNVIINLFNGPAVNAARGIAMQVSGAVTGFVGNFMTAVSPQITKSYAAGEYDYMFQLIYKSARFSFYLLLLLSLPILVNTHYILLIWLKQVPEHSALFVQLVLIFVMSESISNPLVTAMLATGRIRNYQIVVGGLQMMNLPVSYALLRLGFIPETVLIVAIIISQCCLFARLIMLRDLIHIRAMHFIKDVYLNTIVVTLIAATLPALLSYHLEENFLNFILLCLCSLITSGLSIYYVGCSRSERAMIVRNAFKIKTRILHL